MQHSELSKTQLAEVAMTIVADITDLSISDILSPRRSEEYVDARYILVHLLTKQGFYTADIARVMRRTYRTIELMKAGWDARLEDPGRKMFQRLARLAELQLRNNSEIPAK